MSMNEVVKKLSQAIDKQADKAKTTAYDTPATVRRIEGDTAWVHIPGGVDETPVKMTISAKEGDSVQVRVSGGSAFIVGNGTNPPTDDARANEAYAVAGDAIDSATMARTAALTAEASAASAQSAAASAQANAAIAKATTDEINTYADSVSKTVTQVLADGETAGAAAQAATEAADSALYGLSTVEDVVGVLNWITAHGTMTLTSDVTVNPAHVYFIVDAGGDYVVGGTHYSIVSEPKDAELSTYYELTVDESVQNYVATHIVVDTEGLWIVPDSGGNKVLIATGSGSTYTTAGTYIIGKVNNVDTIFAQFTTNGMTTNAASGTQIAHLGYGPGKNSGGGTSDKPYYTFGIRPNGSTVGNYSVAEGSNSTASGYSSHAEGGSIASGVCAHAEGDYSKATGDSSHAEGNITTANAHYSHSEGDRTTASGQSSHAEGSSSESSGTGAHAQNLFTKASKAGQTALGTYNVEDTSSTTTHPSGTAGYGKYAAIIGNGTADNARSNALTVDWSGNVDIASGAKYKINGTALAASDVGAMPVMAGVIQMYAGGTEPTGWLFCDGDEYLKSDYPALYAVIGDTYGDPNKGAVAPSDSDHFRVPDLSGRMPIGVGESTADGHTAHTLAEADGKEAYKLTGAQSGVQDHNHVYYDYDSTYSFSTGYRTTTDHSHYAYTGSTVSRANHQRTTNGGGAKNATDDHTNMPPYLGINFIIATGKTA